MADAHWPFDQPRNCMAFALRSIVFDGAPILYVSHDADDHGWQFLDGKPIDMANAALVRLDTIVRHDSSVLAIADMQRRARRKIRLGGACRRTVDNPPLERTAAAVYFHCGRASRVRRHGR
jgi:hypothetical protein